MSGVDLKGTRGRRAATTANFDQVAPHSPEDEAAVLGCLLSSPDAFDLVAGSLTEDSFYDPRNATIFGAAMAVRDGGEPVDTLTVARKLKERGGEMDGTWMNHVQGIADMGVMARGANLQAYVDAVARKHSMRRLILECHQTIQDAYSKAGQEDAVLEDFERRALAVRRGLGRRDRGIKDVVRSAVARVEQMHTREPGVVSGLSTGIGDLDKLTDGLHPGEFTIIAAFPNEGKTALAMNLVEHCVLDVRVPAGVFSLEMDAESLALRIMASRARVNIRATRQWTQEEFDRFTLTSARLANSMLHLEDVSDLGVGQFRAMARRMVREHGIGLLIVDYLQLLNADGSGKIVEKKSDEVSAISNVMKATAKELKVPVVALSQLTEGDGGRQVKLRGSRDLSADSDNIWVLEPGQDKPGSDACPVTLWIRKQRNGPRNEPVNLTFLKRFTRFEQATRMGDDR